MKKIVCAILTVLMLSSAYAQIAVPVNEIKVGAKFDKNQIKSVKDSKKMQNGDRAVLTFELDYDAADETYATDLGFTYQRSANLMNTRFNTAALADSAENFSVKWVAVKFDSLYDGINQIGYPLPGATITVDSIFFLANHTNVSGTNDTLKVRILQIAANASGLLSSNQGVTLTNTVLWEEEVVSDVSVTPGVPAGQAGVLAFGPGLTLPVGTGYIVQLLYSGPKEDEFIVVDGNRDECGGACIVSQSIFPDNSYGYLNWYNTTQNQNFSGIPNLNGLAADCNQNGTVESDACEFFLLQNVAIWSRVTVDVPLSATVSPTSFAGCPGATVPLNAAGVGGTAPYNFTWSTGATTATINVTVGATNQTYTVTVTDGNNDTKTATVTVSSNGVNVELGNDVSLGCGQTTTLSPVYSGNVQGATYAWNTGATTLSVSNIGPGTYQVTVSNAAGCTASDVVGVTLSGTDQALNFNSPSQYLRNCELEITNQSIRTAGWNFEWNFGDGNLAFDVNPTHTWSSLGTFTITLTADSFGCQVIRTKTIQIVNGTCPGTGVDEQLLSNITVYPNPTNGKFVVSLDAVTGKNAVINVVNMNGQVVVSEKFTATGNDAKEIDLASFANGIYLVNIQVDGKTASRTLLKQ